FMVQGTLIGVIGTVLGLAGGVTLTWNLERILDGIEALFGVTLLPEDVYYITGLPTDMQAGDVVTTLVVALVMSFLATLYPAWRAARTQPAEALRYEYDRCHGDGDRGAARRRPGQDLRRRQDRKSTR